MTALLRMSTLLLLLTVAAMPALPMVWHDGVSAHTAGCHGHRSGSHPEKSAPVNFRCCVDGGHAAWPGALFSPRNLPAEILAAYHEDFFMKPARGETLAAPLPPSVSPPDFAPLRI